MPTSTPWSTTPAGSAPPTGPALGVWHECAGGGRPRRGRLHRGAGPGGHLVSGHCPGPPRPAAHPPRPVRPGRYAMTRPDLDLDGGGGRLPARLDPHVIVPDPANPALCEDCWGQGCRLVNRRQTICRTCYGTGHHPTPGGVW